MSPYAKFWTTEASKIVAMSSIAKRSHVPALLTTLLALAFHGIMVVSNSLIWDGWMQFSWIKHGQWDFYINGYGSSGYLLGLWLHRPFLEVSDPLVTYKLASWLCIAANGLAINWLLRCQLRVEQPYSLFFTSVYLAFPFVHVLGDPAVWLYQACTTLFLTGWVLLSVSSSHQGLRFLVLRVTAIVLLFESYSYNALLPLSYVFAGLLLVARWRAESSYGLGNLMRRFLEQADVFALPIFFWLAKELVTPRFGPHAAYNRIQFNAQVVLSGAESVLSTAIDMLRATAGADIAAFALIGGALGAMATLIARRGLPPRAASVRMGALALVLGITLAVTIAFPYVVVGRGFSHYGWGSLYLFLFGLPAAALATAALHLVEAVLPKGGAWIAGLFAGATIATWGAMTIDMHLLQIARAAQDRSAMLNFSRHPAAKRYNVYFIRATYPLPGTTPSYNSIVWTYIFKEAVDDREIRRIFLTNPPANSSLYSRNEIRSSELFVYVPYTVDGFSANGPQGRVVVSSRGSKDFRSLAFEYLRHRLLPEGDQEGFLSALTEVEIGPL